MDDKKIIQIIPAPNDLWVKTDVEICEQDEHGKFVSVLDENKIPQKAVESLKVICLALTEASYVTCGTEHKYTEVYPMVDWGCDMGIELLTETHNTFFRYGEKG